MTPTRPHLFVYVLASISFLIVAAAALTTLPFLFVGEFALIGIKKLSVDATVAFWCLFAFRYFRLAVNIVSYLAYKPSPITARPSYTSSDVTVLIPTVDNNEAFFNCAQSICLNNPACLFVITASQEMRDAIDAGLSILRDEFPKVNIEVHNTAAPNKRRQIDYVTPLIQTRLTCMVDATVIWGPRFLLSALAPFEDPNICLVGTNKRVQRVRNAGLFASFWNFIGCLYLERHNFECRAQNAISGEVFVISGRTNVIRTAIIQDPNFRIGYTDEYCFFNKFGPLAADDDNFIVRWILKQGGGIKFQYDDDARIGIAPIGEFPRFLSQCRRWARTTWRSNPAALRIPHVWINQPYSVYSIYLASFLNFALFTDAFLVYLMCQTDYISESNRTGIWLLVTWIICSKGVKLITYFYREPRDVLFFPFYILFVYYHSFLKLWALLTFWDISWAGRNLIVDAPFEAK
jgi:cellulose synthase/poly-beta-1,6-N-acetylglucosamine synthase-like glycosyltransferase